jgi:acetyltransferase-like isoleucine patch superfamily enzyme
MVVINNYDAAKDAKCVTQIKFAVTNGGVFSMEKRSTDPGTTTDWSQWESIGGSSLGKWDDKSTFVIEHIENASGNITIGSDTTLGSWVKIGNNVYIGDSMYVESKKSDNGNDYFRIGTDTDSTSAVIIGYGVTIGSGIKLKIGESEQIEIERGGNTLLTLGTDNQILNHTTISPNVHISNGVCIGTGFDGSMLTASLKVQVNSTGDKVIFSYNGKSAELQLT